MSNRRKKMTPPEYIIEKVTRASGRVDYRIVERELGVDDPFPTLYSTLNEAVMVAERKRQEAEDRYVREVEKVWP